MKMREKTRTQRASIRGEVHQEGAPSLAVTGLSKHYDGRFAIQEVNFEVKIGERVAVVGPNGAGKSTLFKVVAGVLAPSSGEVRVYGHKPGGHICIAYVPQRSQVDWSFPATVADVVMMGRIGMIGFLHQPSAEDREYVKQCLELVNIAHLGERQIGELSGGQQQRMFIARALAQQTELMLMDEPFSGLDVPTQEDIFEIMDTLREQGVTVLVATHDLNLAAERFDRILLLNNRMLGYGKPTEVFTTERLTAAYGGHLHMVETEDGFLMVSDTCCDEDEVAPGG